MTEEERMRLPEGKLITTPQGQPAEPKPAARLIGLCGYAGSGKDAAAAFLTGLPDGHPDGPWERVAFADAVRAGLLALDPSVAVRQVEVDNDNDGEPSIDFVPVRLSEYIEICGGWDEAKKSAEVRRLLQRYGTEAGREIHGADCWVSIVENKSIYVGCRVVITDVRFQNELDMIRRRGGIIVRISRPGIGPKNDHVSERLVGEITADADIVNDGGLDELRAKVWEVAGVRAWEPPVITTKRFELPPDIKRQIESNLRKNAERRHWQPLASLRASVRRIAGFLSAALDG